jgi:transcriptional regulator with XRE-family HTH domain
MSPLLSWYIFGMDDTNQRQHLGGFVRAHRERLRPDGLTGRRRTPGLRREELAERAGISATWCAWIEQGRDVRASPQALAGLARALEFTRAERAYLFELAGRRDPDAPIDGPLIDAPISLRVIVEALPTPAYGLDSLWNACCWNDAAARLFRGWLDDEANEPNLLRFVFLRPAAQALIPDWELRARRLLAEFRADYSRRFQDGRARALTDQLKGESPLFAEAWSEQLVSEREGGRREFIAADGAVLTFEQHTFSPAERPDYKLVVLSPVEAR